MNPWQRIQENYLTKTGITNQPYRVQFAVT